MHEVHGLWDGISVSSFKMGPKIINAIESGPSRRLSRSWSNRDGLRVGYSSYSAQHSYFSISEFDPSNYNERMTSPLPVDREGKGAGGGAGRARGDRLGAVAGAGGEEAHEEHLAGAGSDRALGQQ